MVLAGKLLKNHPLLFPHMKHVSCLAHAIHVACSKIIDCFPLTNLLIANMKKLLVKASSRKKAWTEQTQHPLPPDPIITRWGSWLKSAFYYAENYKTVELFINTYTSTSETAALEKLKKLVKKKVKEELVNLMVFKQVPVLITKLEMTNND